MWKTMWFAIVANPNLIVYVSGYQQSILKYDYIKN
jgi:hypothetical protein